MDGNDDRRFGCTLREVKVAQELGAVVIGKRDIPTHLDVVVGARGKAADEKSKRYARTNQSGFHGASL